MANKTETWDVDCSACGDIVTVPAESALPPTGWSYLPVVGGGRDYYCPPCADEYERDPLA